MAGNANSGKRQTALFFNALNMALKDEKANPHALRKVANKLIKEAIKGEPWAVKELADRLDGKPAQTLRGDDDAPLISMIVTGVPRPQDDSSNN